MRKRLTGGLNQRRVRRGVRQPSQMAYTVQTRDRRDRPIYNAIPANFLGGTITPDLLVVASDFVSLSELVEEEVD